MRNARRGCLGGITHKFTSAALTSCAPLCAHSKTDQQLGDGILRVFALGGILRSFSKRWHLFPIVQAVLVHSHEKKRQFPLFSLVGAHQKWKIKEMVSHLNSKTSFFFWCRGPFENILYF